MLRLTIVRDGDEFILGRADLGVYVAVPPPGAVFVEALQDGQTLARATESASEAAGEEVDATDFLTGLREAGLLDPPPGPSAAPDGRLHWLERVPQRLVQPLFGRVAWSFYALAAVSIILMLTLRPDMRPIFDDVWFLTDPIWSVIAIMVIAVVITAGHECWHWLAGRAVGVPAKFRVSRRGIFIVFETDLSQLATIARHSRYSPILAGYAFDVTLMALAMGLRLGFREEIFHHSPEFDRFLGAVVFRQMVVLIWQLAGVAFRTDTYVLLANALGCHNLHRATTLTARYRLWKLNEHEAQELAGMGKRDRSVANWFWLVYLGGVFAMFAILVTYLAPFAFGMIVWIGPNIASMAPQTLAFWQSIAVVVMLLAQFAAVPLIGIREKRQRLRSSPSQETSTRSVQSAQRPVWQAFLAVFAICAAVYVFGELRKFVEASSDASRDNLASAGHVDTCLPGLGMWILDFPHISVQEAKTVVYNSNPATSGPHYGAAVAPGIYRSSLPDGQTVHALEHGRVVIHYRPGTQAEVVAKLESIGKRFARDTVVHPNPRLDSQIALTAWGRIDTMDSYDEARILRFTSELRGRYDHHSTASATECS
jgi:putative peptide zinc metalloprotease protein